MERRMKVTSTLSRERGVALLIVLGSIIFLTVLVVGFLSATRTELASSKSFASSTQARTLSETAVSLVIGQVEQATSRTDEAWISQPGLLRTFDETGNPTKAFKLYSNENMVVDGAFDPAGATASEVPLNWNTLKARYVDLNAPVSRNNELIYPILDPYFGPTGAAPDDRKVKGFNITSSPGYSGSGAAPDNNPAPMPVQWLYVLKDGAVVSPAGGSGNVANLPGASAENPPVGRVAFWADDDTTKININTAVGDEWATNDPTTSNADDFDSMGSFWDTPFMKSRIDTNSLSPRQPVRNEFQRYPGHPATTYLSAVFPYLNREQLSAMVPRAQIGGSRGGTVGTDTGTSAISLDGDRLYASTDELVFGPATSGPGREQNVPTPKEIAGASFFLTAHSRSPDVNLFNRPRVSVWPQSANVSNRTQVDRLLARASTVGDKSYYFTRNSAASAQADINIPRNQALYRYLQDQTKENIPGFGGNFLAKYGSDRDQILTEIFDYIRTTNLAQAGATTYTPAPPFVGSGQVIPTSFDVDGQVTRGFGRFVTLSEVAILLYRETEDSESTSVPPVPTLGTVRAILLFELFAPALGFAEYYPNLVIEVSGLDSLKFAVNGTEVSPFTTGTATMQHQDSFGALGPGNHERRWGGWLGPLPLFRQPTSGFRTVAPGPGSPSNTTTYPFVSQPFTVRSTISATLPNPKITILGGNLQVKLRSPNGQHEQTFALSFPTSPALEAPKGKETFGARLTRTNNAAIYYDLIGSESSATPQRDIVRSVEIAPGVDLRQIALTKDVPSAKFEPTAGYFQSGLALAHSLRTSLGYTYPHSSWPLHSGSLTLNASNQPISYNMANFPFFSTRPSMHNATRTSPPRMGGLPGNPLPDWDTGIGISADGPYINKADEGNVTRAGGRNDPYFTEISTLPTPTLFSPNRQIPSAVMFGSLPAGVVETPSSPKAWRTLLFSPVSAADIDAPNTHPGNIAPPDHLLLDLFNMPVVEPYAISEPFSTAGRANLNYQIAPFTYIERSTHLQGILRSVRVTGIPANRSGNYKYDVGLPEQTRLPIDIVETLEAFTERFDNNEPFISASEICTIPLVPQGATAGTLNTWWNERRLTGDNLRERPYAVIYPRLTTKSNTYTVHVRAESLQKSKATPPGTWTEGSDLVTGEFRGSFTIERYLNPNIETHNDADALTDYKFRTVYSKEFNP